ncbi:MAG: hypothetical protein COZ06_30225, partial [Armatimonadetes bacterium CG_4_10_14_3_um_filter_66_18]
MKGTTDILLPTREGRASVGDDRRGFARVAHRHADRQVRTRQDDLTGCDFDLQAFELGTGTRAAAKSNPRDGEQEADSHRRGRMCHHGAVSGASGLPHALRADKNLRRLRLRHWLAGYPTSGLGARPRVAAFLLALGLPFMVFSAGCADQDVSMTSHGPAKLIAVHPNAETVPTYGKFELSVNLQGEFTNPFDPEDVSLDGHFITPEGKEQIVPGFFYWGWE